MPKIDRRLGCAALVASSLQCGALDAAEAQTAASLIDEALQNITSLVRPGRVGYATTWDGNKYVQCRRQSDKAVRCEAAGASMQPSLRSVLTGERLDRMANHGWMLDPSFGNYVRTFSAETPTANIAQAIVSVLREAYNANLARLEFSTTWIADVPCPPRNGPSQNLAGLVNDASAMRAVVIHSCSYTAQSEITQKTTSAAELIAVYGAITVAEIQRLRINANRPVYVVFDAGIGYVQCAPQTMPLAIYCEAQSAESWPALSSILTPERVALLHKAGYADPGRVPNYSKTYIADRQSDTDIASENPDDPVRHLWVCRRGEARGKNRVAPTLGPGRVNTQPQW